MFRIKIPILVFMIVVQTKASTFESHANDRGNSILNSIETEILKESHQRDSLEESINRGWPPPMHFGWGATFLLLGFGFTIATDSMQEEDTFVYPLVGAGIIFSIIGAHQIYLGYKKKAVLARTLGS